MRFFRNSTRYITVAGELFAFFWASKRWWLVPMLAMLVLLAGLIALAQSSAIAPFIYSLY
jgi:hypothetical protein